MAPILYKTDASPPGRAVMMMADILGVELELRELNPVLRQQDTPEFTKKNPMRTVPILEEEDYFLADSHAINIYLLDKYGRPEHSSLYPCDKRKRATINQRLHLDSGVLFPALRAVMGPAFFGKLTKLSRYMIRNIEDSYRILEAYLSANLYMADDDITVADINILATVSSLNGVHPIDVKKYPKLKHWLSHLSQKDFYKKWNEHGCELLVKAITTNMHMAAEANAEHKSKL